MPAVIDRRDTSRQASPRRYSFRCYAYKRSKGQWDAVCLDLSLRVHGESLDDAVQQMKDAIQSYVETVRDAGWENDMIPRRAPVLEWLPWYWAHFKGWIRFRRDHLTSFFLTGPTPDNLTVAAPNH